MYLLYALMVFGMVADLVEIYMGHRSFASGMFFFCIHLSTLCLFLRLRTGKRALRYFLAAGKYMFVGGDKPRAN